MDTVQVKICGLTNREDALVAAEAGADFLGFIFYPPSKRMAEPEEVERFVQELKALPSCPKLVGVFVDEPVDYMLSVVERCRLDLIQLHGSEVPSLVNDPNSRLYGKAFKALRPRSIPEAEADIEWYSAEHRDVLPTVLIDSYHPTLKGGTGELSDWEIARRMMTHSPHLMLAGGLTVENVAQAISEVRPFGVDVASGVEASPGMKDHAKLKQFIQNAKSN